MSEIFPRVKNQTYTLDSDIIVFDKYVKLKDIKQKISERDFRELNQTVLDYYLSNVAGGESEKPLIEFLYEYFESRAPGGKI